MGDILGSIKEGFEYVIYNTIYRLFYYAEIAFCQILNLMQGLFRAFSGIDRVHYGNNDDYLVNIFFGNRIITAIYWGMAIIGIILIFVFTIMAVIKKSFDLDGKVQRSHSQILRAMLRGILVIISMNLVIMISVNFTNVLMESVNTLFTNAGSVMESGHKEYTDEEYAAMSRIFNTIGNYSLNPSYKNRYNLNACYNEIRADIKYLAEHKVFDFYYETETDDGKTVNTWQSVLQDIANAADYNKDQPIDIYDEQIANAIDNCINVLRSDSDFHALEYYDEEKIYSEDSVPLDRTLFLIATMGNGSTAAAKNDKYNKDPSLFDDIRGPYYMGKKDIYSLNQVNKDFDISVMKTNYLIVYIGAIVLIVNMALIMVNCIVRLFNLLFLYLIAPPIIATSPLDDGAKFNQWIIAFVVQLFSVFGTVISMRLFLIYVPIVMNPSFQITSNSLLNAIGKLVMIWAGCKAVNKANALLTGILSGTAAHTSGAAADASHDLKRSAVGRGAAAVRHKFESGVGQAALKTANVAARVATLPVRPIYGAAKNTAAKVKLAFNQLESAAENSIVKPPPKPGGGGSGGGDDDKPRGKSVIKSRDAKIADKYGMDKQYHPEKHQGQGGAENQKPPPKQ